MYYSEGLHTDPEVHEVVLSSICLVNSLLESRLAHCQSGKVYSYFIPITWSILLGMLRSIISAQSVNGSGAWDSESYCCSYILAPSNSFDVNSVIVVDSIAGTAVASVVGD